MIERDKSEQPSAGEDSLQHERRRADTWRGYAIFAGIVLGDLLIVVLIVAVIFYGMPALRAWSDASVEGAGSARKLSRLIDDNGEKFTSAIEHINNTTANADTATSRAVTLIGQFDQNSSAVLIALKGLLIESRSGIRGATGALAVLVRGLDQRINGDAGLLASVTSLASELGTTVETMKLAIAKLISEGTATLAEIKAIIADPNVKQMPVIIASTLHNLDLTTIQLLCSSQNIEQLTANIAKASDRFPEMAELLKKIMSTSQKYQKPMLILTLLGLLTKALQGVLF